jgi:hypothetical protein
MGPCESKVTLRLRHPTWQAEKISKLLGLAPSFAWSAGERRKTANGVDLGGFRQETYWTLRIDDNNSQELPERLEMVLRMFRGKHKLLRRFCAAGGSLECFVGIFLDRNCGVTLDQKLLRRLGAAGIALGLDIYGGPDEKFEPSNVKRPPPAERLPKRGSE